MSGWSAIRKVPRAAAWARGWPQRKLQLVIQGADKPLRPLTSRSVPRCRQSSSTEDGTRPNSSYSPSYSSNEGPSDDKYWGASYLPRGHQNWPRPHIDWQHQMGPHMERITDLYNKAIFSSRLLYASALAVAAAAGLVLYNWKFVRSNVSRESAEVIAETIQDQKVHISVKEFTKELLHMLFNDKEVEKLCGAWVYRLLLSIQNEIGELCVHILQQEQVIAAVNRLADRIVEYLCSNEVIQQRVGQLLVDAISLQSSRDAAAGWAYDLVMREDVTEGFAKLVVTALQMDLVVSEAGVLSQQVVNRVLQDPEVIAEAKNLLNQTLRDSELRAAAKESLWNIVVPWSSTGREPDKMKRAAKSLDELAASDALTVEERRLLKSIQARIRTGEDTVAAGVPSASAASLPDDEKVATVPRSAPAEPMQSCPTPDAAHEEAGVSIQPQIASDTPAPTRACPLATAPPRLDSHAGVGAETPSDVDGPKAAPAASQRSAAAATERPLPSSPQSPVAAPPAEPRGEKRETQSEFPRTIPEAPLLRLPAELAADGSIEPNAHRVFAPAELADHLAPAKPAPADAPDTLLERGIPASPAQPVPPDAPDASLERGIPSIPPVAGDAASKSTQSPLVERVSPGDH